MYRLKHITNGISNYGMYRHNNPEASGPHTPGKKFLLSQLIRSMNIDKYACSQQPVSIIYRLHDRLIDREIVQLICETRKPDVRKNV